MSISTNKYLNHVATGLGKISNGKIENALIHILYWWYRMYPPAHVRKAKQYYSEHADEISIVEKLLSDEKSKEVYRAMIAFRSTYDMRKHPEYSLNDIYFVKDIVQLKKDEVFIDCGAFDGDSIYKFLENAGDYKRIVAFEPDRQNYEKLAILKEKMGTVLYNKGVWSKNTLMHFDEKGNEASGITDNSDGAVNDIEVVAIDNVEECSMATIKRNHPKLAISIYHKDEDMIELPLYIHSLVPEYKMHVRQHSHSFFDTVLYCVPAE